MAESAAQKKDGRYLVTTTDAGIHLTVWPPVNGGIPVSKTAIIQELANHSITQIDHGFVSKIIWEALGIPTLIAHASVKQDGTYRITRTASGLQLTVWPPSNGGKPVLKSTIIEDLNRQNFHGYDPDFLSRIIWEAQGLPVLIGTSYQTKDGCYQLSATDDGLHLAVWPPTGGGQPVSSALIFEELHRQHISNFDKDFIGRIVREALGIPTLIVHSFVAHDGRYDITATDAGIHLTVWPPAHGGSPVTSAQIFEDLESRNLTNFDKDFIGRVIREAVGTPVLIINSIIPAQRLSHIRVKLSHDRLEAIMDATMPADGTTITLDDLLEKLESMGINYGIDYGALNTVVEMGCCAELVCARGTPPQDGKDAYFKYHVDPESQGRPEELEDGRVDFKETNRFLCVEEGQLLIEKIPATEGTPGKDVTSMPIPAKAGKNMRMPTGKNIVVLEDWRLYSAIHGHINMLHNKKINVVPIIVIEGDVDYATGNIDFMGSVVVKGSVQTDFHVKAGGNVEVFGTICGGFVEASSIIVHKGIQGMGRSIIKAKDRVVANFIENATVYADQDIVVSDVILNSTATAGMRVIVEGRRGLILGSKVSAGEVIRACTVGNPAGIVTELEVAANPFFKEELSQLRQDIIKTEKVYTDLKTAVTFIRNQGIEHLPPEKRDRYKKSEAEFFALPDRIEEMKRRAAFIEEFLVSLKPGRVRVRDTVHPGTKISIGSLSKYIKESLQFVSFYSFEGEIRFSALR